MTTTPGTTRLRRFLVSRTRYPFLTACLLAVSALTQAQTAHFNGNIVTLDSTPNPRSVAVDRSGNVYFIDYNTSGLYEALAVNGSVPLSNPTIVPLGSGFNDPEGVVVDPSGNVYVTDQGHGLVKELLAVNGSVPVTNPTIVTLGSGFVNPSGIALDKHGNLYVTDLNSSDKTLKEFMAVSGTIPQTNPTIVTLASGFSFPAGVAIDANGNAYVADATNGIIELHAVSGAVPANTTTYSTLGSGFSSPFGVAVDSSGNVYVADAGNNAIKEMIAVNGSVPLSSPVIDTLGSGFNHPQALAVDANRNIYLADSFNGLVKEIKQQVVTFGSLATGTPSTAVPLTFTFDSGGTIGLPAVLTEGVTALDFADDGTGSCTTNGTSHSYNTGDTCTVNVTFTPTHPYSRPGSVVLSTNGNVPIASVSLLGVGTGPQVTFPNTALIEIGSVASNYGNLIDPYGVVVDGAANVYIADYNKTTLVVIPALCTFSSCPTSTRGGNFFEPYSLAIDGAGNIYIADFGNNAIKKMPLSCMSSACVTTIGGGFNQPKGVAVDAGGNVYVADGGNFAVKEIPPGCLSFACVTLLGGGFEEVDGVAVDGSGTVFVSDPFNSDTTKKVSKIPPGCISSACVTGVGGGFNLPVGLSVSGNGTIYIADTTASVLQMMPETCTSSSCVVTLAGSGYYGVNNPAGVFVTAGDDVYVTDSTNHKIKEIDQSGLPSLSYASTAVGASSAQQVVAIENTGNAPLAISALSGTNASFAGAGTTCTTSAPLAVDATCNLGIEFAPLAPGNPLAGTATVTDNAFPATQSIPVSGTATGSAPTVTGVSPTGGGSTGGTPVTITGTNFYPGSTVSFGATAATGVVVVSLTSITAIAPAGSGTVNVTVSEGGNTSAANAGDQFTYVLTPSVSGISPAGGSSAGGTTITITGANFAAGATVRFGTASATGVTFGSGTSITATAPAGSGQVHVAVTTPGGTSIPSASDLFSYITMTTAVASPALTRNHAVTAFAPVTATGGSGALTYTVSPALPAGLNFSSSSGTVSGTATAASAATTYTVTATDSHGDTATATFSLTVNGAVSAAVAVASTVLTQNHAAAAFTPVTASGGTGTLTYSVSPTLPVGLSLAASTGTISGTSTASSPATVYTVTVTDSDGATATASFSLTVNGAVIATTNVASIALAQNHMAAAFTPVTASGGTGTLSYSIAPLLPVGLSFSPAGAISGTPTVISAAATYTVTVTDSNGATATASFSLRVNGPVSAVTAAPVTVLTQNHAAPAFTPVTASGGAGTLTYTVSPALPAGLSFSSSGTVSGTPTAPSAAAAYTVTVTDSNGVTATAGFSLTVNGPVSAVAAVSSTTLVQNHAVTAFTPVTATGGTGTLTFSVAPALPAGLSFSPAGTVAGTPTVTMAATIYTVTVTDANGATATAAFSLAVNSAIVIATTTTATSSNLTPDYGDTVVLTATVTPAPADTLAGTVSFYTGSRLLGTVALNSSGVATLSISLPLGANAITAVYSGNAGYAGSTSSALSVSNRTGSSITFAASPTTQLYNNPIVLTAQASSSTPGSLTGTVSFLDGTNLIATVPIGPGGQVSYSDTTLADGSHTLTASYSGDANYLASTSSSSSTTVTVGNINLNLGNDGNQSVVPGAAVSYNFPLSPLVTPTFLYDVQLTATGLPAGATYTFTPAFIPAGSGSMPVTLTIQTAKSVAALTPKNPLRRITEIAFALLLPLLGAKPFRKRLLAIPNPLAILLFAVLSFSAAIGLAGCGSGGFFGKTATSGNYVITVTATSANLVRVSTVQLNIE